MKPSSFLYHRPTTVDEVTVLLGEYGEESKLLAGGQSLLPLLNLRLAFPEHLIDINEIDGLDEIEVDTGVLRVGALVRQERFLHSSAVTADLPLAASAVAHVGHHVTRNRGTVAGSLAHADSRGELPVALTALGGSVLAVSTRGQREIPASELFVTEFTSSLAPDEMIIESRWPVLGSGWGYSFSELAIRHGDYALAMVAVAVRVVSSVIRESRLVVGSVADRPLVLDDVATGLIGQHADVPVDGALRDGVYQAVDPAGDVHASAAYRRNATATLATRAVAEAIREASHA